MPRIATVCIKGNTAAETRARLRSRLQWLSELVEHINCRWKNLDAVLLPGGYFYISEYIGLFSYELRVSKLEKLKAVSDACRTLRQSPGSLIIAGVDGCIDRKMGLVYDQFCVAWDVHGIAGIGRKIFPVGGVNGEANELACYRDDFSSNRRVISLPSGSSALLCACYDGYVVSGRNAEDRKWAKSVKYVANFGERPAFADNNLVHSLKGDFCTLLDRVEVALVSIHSFEHNATAFWQRHGLSKASSALGNNGYAYGAAHFCDKLPSAAEKSVLTAGSNKASQPADWFYLDSKSGRSLVRLFE